MHRRLKGLTGLIASCVLATAGHAASLHISPVSLKMASDQSAVRVVLSNPSDQPIVAQIRLYAWSQSTDADSLDAQHELVVSPPHHQYQRTQRAGGAHRTAWPGGCRQRAHVSPTDR